MEWWHTFMNTSSYFNHSPWFPNPVICARDMVRVGVPEVMVRLPWNGLGVWLEETRKMILWTVYVDKLCIILPLVIAVFLTCLRKVLDSHLYERVPVWFNLSDNGRKKFPESAWKSLIYGITWIWAFSIVLSRDGIYFFDLKSHWSTWHPGMAIQPSIYWLYMLEMGFYLHSVYATIYIETIRKDFNVMLTHHFLAYALLWFSYVTRSHLIGVLILCFLDIGDLILESGKCILYFKHRNGKQYFWPELVANVVFALFSLQFLFCRIYWLATKVLYSVTYVGHKSYGPGGPWYLLFMPMLVFLYVIQVYWFRLIVLVLYKTFIKGEVIAEAERDYEVKKRQKNDK